MKAREFDAHRLDVKSFAKLGGRLQGQWRAASFGRLGDALAPDAAAHDAWVHWSAQGLELPVRAGPAQTWLHLQASAELPLICQRCLATVLETIQLDRQFQFVADEAQAAELDADVEHEVLVVARELDLQVLLEDELLLDLPLVPRHVACPQPLSVQAVAGVEPDQKSPFAALAALRRPPD